MRTCPRCKNPIPAGFDPSNPDAPVDMQPGDYALCYPCGAVLVLLEGDEARVLTWTEYVQMDRTNRAVLERARAARYKLAHDSLAYG